MAVNRAVSSHAGRVRPGSGRCQWRRRPIIPVGNGYHEFRALAESGDVVPVQQPTCMGGLVASYDRKVSFGYNRATLRNRSLRLWSRPPNPLKSTA